LDSDCFAFQVIFSDTEYNHAYFPVIFESSRVLEVVLHELQQNSIFPRRYFYPSLSTLPYVGQQSVPISESIAQRVLCLPLYHSLSLEEVDLICRLIKRAVRYKS